jgi:hypothetical protein
MTHGEYGTYRAISFLFVAVGIVDVVTKLTQYHYFIAMYSTVKAGTQCRLEENPENDQLENDNY